jgi:hypothetical protein
MEWRLGAPEAVTATAHKLDRIVYHLLSTKEAYESVLVQCDRHENTRAEMRSRKQAANLGYDSSPIHRSRPRCSSGVGL